jgi:hypothetical protein
MRQTPINKNRLEKMLNENYGDWEDENARIGFSRNQTLIDLRLIPEDIKNSIIDTYNNTKPAPRSRMINYFMEKKLKNLMEVIEEF